MSPLSHTDAPEYHIVRLSSTCDAAHPPLLITASATHSVVRSPFGGAATHSASPSHSVLPLAVPETAWQNLHPALPAGIEPHCRCPLCRHVAPRQQRSLPVDADNARLPPGTAAGRWATEFAPPLLPHQTRAGSICFLLVPLHDFDPVLPPSIQPRRACRLRLLIAPRRHVAGALDRSVRGGLQQQRDMSHWMTGARATKCS